MIMALGDNRFRVRTGVNEMKKSITAVLLGLLTVTAFGTSQKMTCTKTGKKIDKCCCEMKDGKFYCKLTKQTYDKCCCEGM